MESRTRRKLLCDTTAGPPGGTAASAGGDWGIKGVKGWGDAVSWSSQESGDQSHSTCAVTDVGAGQRWLTCEASRLPLTCTSLKWKRCRGPPGRPGMETQSEQNNEIRITNIWGEIFYIFNDGKQFDSWFETMNKECMSAQIQTQLVGKTDRQTAPLPAGSHNSSTHLNILLSVLFLLLACKRCVMRLGFSTVVISPLHKKEKKKNCTFYRWWQHKNSYHKGRKRNSYI